MVSANKQARPGRSGSRKFNWRKFNWRGLGFRIAAVLIGISPFLLGEGFCRFMDWGRPDWTRDPLVGFDAVEPLFVLDRAENRFEIPISRQAFFCPDGFPARKPENEYRIFCLGGSTVQGRPYARQTAFSSWLELSLQTLDSSRGWRVVNCGGVSYASYRLVPILEEVLRHEPDLIILCTGHNEFLEERTYSGLKQAPRPLGLVYRLLRGSRLIGTLLQWSGQVRPASTARDAPALLPAEVDALLDHRGGLEAYRRDDPWRDQVGTHYGLNLERMANLCRESQVPLILVNPVSNVADCPPFKFAPDESLSEDQRLRFERLWTRATQQELSLEQRTGLLEDALAVDPRHAGARFQLGKCYQASGRFKAALEQLLRAKDEDLCPLRMLESMHDTLQAVARRERLPLVDARKKFEQLSPQGLVGDQWLLDHVHPSIRGHQVIAELLVEELARQGILPLRDDGKAERQAAYRRHLGTLDGAYFARGKERLEGLRRWAAGRSGR